MTPPRIVREYAVIDEKRYKALGKDGVAKLIASIEQKACEIGKRLESNGLS